MIQKLLLPNVPPPTITIYIKTFNIDIKLKKKKKDIYFFNIVIKGLTLLKIEAHNSLNPSLHPCN